MRYNGQEDTSAISGIEGMSKYRHTDLCVDIDFT